MEPNPKEVSTGETRELQQASQIDPGKVPSHLDTMVRRSVEQTLNQLLDAEADSLCKTRWCKRSPERVDTRPGHYQRKLHTKAGEVMLLPRAFAIGRLHQYSVMRSMAL